MILEETCPACGDEEHPGLCKPALATRLAEAINDRDHALLDIAAMRVELTALRIEVHHLSAEVHQL